MREDAVAGSVAALGALLQELSGLVMRAPDQGGGPRAALGLLAERLGATGGMWVKAEDSKTLVLAADVGVPLDEEALPERFVSHLYEEVFRYGRAVRVADDPDFAGSVVGAPLLSGERPTGGLFLIREHASPLGAAGALPLEDPDGRPAIRERPGPFPPEAADALHLLARGIGAQLESHEQVKRTSARRAELEAVLASMVDGLVVLDRRGYVSSFNDAFKRMSGRDAFELYEMRWSQLIQPRPNTSSPRVLSDFFEAVLAGRPMVATGTPAQLRRPGEGEALFVAVGLATIEEGGRVTGAVLSVRDATVETKLERMKDDFIATVSHDLKTPLTTISGFVELMRNHQLARDEQVPLLDIIIDECQRLARMISSLLDLSKVQSGRLGLHPERFAMRRLIERCVKSFRVRHAATHTIEVEVVPPGGSLVADADRLSQVLINLVGNAVKYSPEGGKVTIRARRQGKWWDLSVADEGIGIPEASLQKLFHRFYRVNEQQSTGSGLGLFITKAIVERHGGTIRAESLPGQGCTFRVRLPVLPPEEAPLQAGRGRGAPEEPDLLDFPEFSLNQAKLHESMAWT